ncbi:Uncharacterised protein [Citrobacter amalonaticus]|nr:Uncharacterised protein [Citrobacter amalonaticus]
MDLIDKQYVVRLKVGQHRSQIARFFQHRTGSGTQIDAHFIGNDIGKRGFPQSGRTKNQQVVERITPQFCRLDENLHLRTHLRLTDILFE